MKKIVFLSILIGGFLFAATEHEKIKEDEAQQRIAACKQREEEANAKIAELQPQVDAVKAVIDSLNTLKAKLQAEFDSLNAGPKYWGKYTVKSGDYLAKIAGMPTIYHDESKWTVLYEANKDIIQDPNLIYPGWILFVPGLDDYKVYSGDCLWKIASYISVYGDASMWPKIYEANKDKIKNPNLIYPNQEFVIPRD